MRKWVISIGVLATLAAGFWAIRGERSELVPHQVEGSPQPQRPGAAIGKPEVDGKSTSVKAAPTAEPSARNSADLDAEFRTAHDQIEDAQEALQTSDLDAQIAIARDRLASLEARNDAVRTAQGDRLQNQAILAQQNDEHLRQTLALLSERIRAQQIVINQLDLQLRTTIAPPDNDVILRQTSALDAAKAALEQLQSQYTSALQSQQALAQSRFEAEARQQNNEQAGQIDTQVAIADTKSRIDSLIQQRQTLVDSLARAEHRLDELKAQASS